MTTLPSPPFSSHLLLSSLATPALFPVQPSIIRLINRLTPGTSALPLAGSMDNVMLTAF